MSSDEKAGLEQDVRGLQVEVAHLGERVDGNTRAIESLGDQVTELAQGQRRLERAVEENTRGLEENTRGLGENTGRLDRHEARLDRIDLRLDGIDLRLDGIDLRLDGIDTRLDRMDSRFDRLESRADEVSAWIAANSLDEEDVGGLVMTWWLQREMGYAFDRLERRFLRAGDEEFEVDHAAEARRGDEVRMVIGEVKARVHVSEIRALVDRNRRLQRGLPMPILALLFCRRIHPAAVAAAQEAGIVLVPWDYQYRAAYERR